MDTGQGNDLEIVQLLGPVLSIIAGGLVAVITVWLQSRAQRQQRETEYIRSVDMESLARLRNLIDAATRMLVHFDVIRGNLIFHDTSNAAITRKTLSSEEVAIPIEIESEYHFAIRRAGVSMDAIDAPEEIHRILTGLNPLIVRINELTLQALNSGDYQCVHEQLECPTKEFGRLVVNLEEHYIELHKQLTTKNQS